MPKTVHEMAVAQAVALGQAAQLKIEESQALHRASLSKAKHDAYELMRTTAVEAEKAKNLYQQENEEKITGAADAQEDLKKALETPFNKGALKQVVEERSELAVDAKKTVNLKAKWQAAEQSAEAA